MIIGHKTQWEFLKRAAKSSRMPQALLFSGAESLGKKKVSLEFIKLINCAQVTEPCGVCLSCELIEKQIHPDVIIVSPEKKEIQIGQIRGLQSQLILTPQLLAQKAVIIDNAETLNSQAQNCLLKTIEEPPGNAVFILLTHLPEALFPTIRSRCETLKFYPVSEEQLINGLKEKKNMPDFKKVIAGCCGRPGLAVNLLKNKKFFQEREARVKTIQKLLKSEISSRFAFSKDFFGKDITPQETETLLEDLTMYLRNMLLAKLDIGKQDASREGSEKYSMEQLKQAVRLTCDLKFLVSSTNINQRLGFENLMLNL